MPSLDQVSAETLAKQDEKPQGEAALACKGPLHGGGDRAGDRAGALP